MRKFIIVLAISLALAPCALAQYASRIRPMPSLPAACNPLNGDVVMLTSGAGVSPGIYNCTATNTWRPAGAIANQYVFNQGTITTSQPFISHTATWNAGGVTFTNLLSVVTDTASAAGSLLMDLQLSTGSIFSVGKAGAVSTAAGGSYGFATRTKLASSADGLLTLTNAAGTDYTRLNLGPVAITHPGLTVSAAVAGKTQGIIITRADGTPAVFADLGAATNGSMIYCSDCTIASPCAGAGNGALAKRLNGAWVCN